jgi:predicted CXXCH cytochrome family protein
MTHFRRFGIALIAALVLAWPTLLIAQARPDNATRSEPSTLLSARNSVGMLSAGQTLPERSAAEVTPTVEPPLQNSNCASCHKDIHASWENGTHSKAASSETFQNEWQGQGKPGACLVCHATGYDPTTDTWSKAGVACESCHNPVPANHPSDKMPVDKSTELCGKCHSEPSLTAGWKSSAHYQRGMTCSVCHDPHTAGMKRVGGGRGMVADASALCTNCHKNAMNNFPTSKHARAGVTCVNCHLGFNAKDKNPGEAHKAPDHDFLPSLETCNKCHTDQMHAPGEAVAAAAIQVEHAGGTPTPYAIPTATQSALVSSEPTPVSPLGFAGIAALIGLAGGMVLAPWLERAYHRYVKEAQND